MKLTEETIIQSRTPLRRTLRRLQEGELTIGILGGSITEANLYNWPNAVLAWLRCA